MEYPELENVIAEAEAAVPNDIEAPEVAMWKDTAEVFRAAAKRLTTAAALIAGMCAEAIPREKGGTVVSEGRVFARTGSPTRKAWKNDDLLRVVKDSRRFNPENGELMTAEELILFVWNLDAPRTTALKQLDIDPDEFCETEWPNRDVKEVPAEA